MPTFRALRSYLDVHLLQFVQEFTTQWDQKIFFENAINLTKISFKVSIFERIKYLALNHIGMSCVPSLMSRVGSCARQKQYKPNAVLDGNNEY